MPVTLPSCFVFPPQRGTLNHCHHHHLVQVNRQPFGGLNLGLNLLLLVYLLSTLLITSLLSPSSSNMFSFTLALGPSKLVISIAGFSGVAIFSVTVVVVAAEVVLTVVNNVV